MQTVKCITTLRENIIPIAGHAPETHRVQYIEYDPQGRELKVINFDHLDHEDDITEFQYDADGRKITEVYAQDGEVLERKFFFYDEAGRISSERKEYLEGNADKLEFEYNGEGQMVQRRLIDDEGELETLELFEYEGDRLIRQAVMDGEENLISEDLYEYNDKGQLLSLLRRNTLDEEEHHEVTVYNEEGLRAEVKQYNAVGKLIERIRFTYDDNSRVVVQDEEDVHHHSLISYTYDEGGRVILQEEKNPDDELISCVSRTFDEEGRLKESESEVAGTRYRAPQHYKLKYEVVYFES